MNRGQREASHARARAGLNASIDDGRRAIGIQRADQLAPSLADVADKDTGSIRSVDLQVAMRSPSRC